MLLRACTALGILLAAMICRAASIEIVSDVAPAPAVRDAIEQLSHACARHKFDVMTKQQDNPNIACRFVIGKPGDSQAVDRLLHEYQLSIGKAPESLLIKTIAGERPRTILLAGRDVRGLMYAVLEAAESIRLAPAGTDALASVHDAAESPRLEVRSVSVHLFNKDLDSPWFFSEEHWHAYCGMLAANRLNNLILTFSDQTNYMAPPFPWWFEMEGFPEVGVKNLSDEERDTNYRMLRRISEIAAEHGVDFTLGIWQQQPVLNPGLPYLPAVRNYGPSDVVNLPTGKSLTKYNTQALGRALRECPLIAGLQLRLNDESGIEPAEQQEYYEKLFSAIRDCGRPIRLELRYKGLQPSTIKQAVDADLDVTVTTKFWCEHLGLPFHPTEQDKLYSANRYGFGTMLRRPRNYKIAFHVWNQGSSRLLLWGDPEYVSRMVESCKSVDAVAFEFFAPLTNKGWGNDPGHWRIFADASLENYRWEFERYWFYYLSYGRMCYNPRTAADVWQREFRQRFGAAATEIETAYRTASQVLPFVTAVNQFSASEWAYWPEIESGGSIPMYAAVQPGDYAQFYALQKFRAPPGWSAEGWSGTGSFVEDAIADRVTAKWSPIQISAHLDLLADRTVQALDTAKKRVPDPQAAEFRATELDLRVLAQLARFHAARKRAATQFAFFEATREAGRLPGVLEHSQQALAAWEEIVRLTDGKYRSPLAFGRARFSVGEGDQPVNAHVSHWKDWLPQVRADVKFAETLIAKHGKAEPTFRTYPGEVTPVERPRIAHTPVTQTAPDQDIELIARVETSVPLRGVFVYYRPLDQTQPWKQLPMAPSGDDNYRAVITSDQFDARQDVQYYLEARIAGGGTLWPDWQEQAPYVIVSVRNP